MTDGERREKIEAALREHLCARERLVALVPADEYPFPVDGCPLRRGGSHYDRSQALWRDGGPVWRCGLCGEYDTV